MVDECQKSLLSARQPGDFRTPMRGDHFLRGLTLSLGSLLLLQSRKSSSTGLKEVDEVHLDREL